MMREKSINKSEVRKRLAALLVALVFVFGTVVIPSQIYAVETEDPALDRTEAVTENTDEVVETSNDDAGNMVESNAGENTETVETETTESQDLSNLIVVTDEDGNSMDISELDESQYDGFLYKLEDNTTKADVREMEQAIGDLNAGQEVEEVISSELYAADSVETISEVVDSEKIEYIEPNYVFHAFDVPDDPDYIEEYNWQLVNTKVPDVWDLGVFGDGAVVAVLDSGVNINHPDLKQESFVKGYDAFTGETGTDNVNDWYGHGTSVTGIIAATRNNGIGFTGAMPNAKIMPVRVLDSNGYGSLATIIPGIKYAVQNGAHVINMSFGGPNAGSLAFENECMEAFNSGVILVSASGNEATSHYGGPVNYPAGFECVVSVASVKSNNTRASTSNYNNKVMVAAPGDNVRLLTKSGDYECNSGTSFAAPQVSALAAMVKSYNPNFRPSKFMDILKITSEDLGDPGYDVEYGYGLINFSNVYGYITNNLFCRDLLFSSSTYVYDGSVKTPGVTVGLGSEKLIQGTDYTVSYAPGRAAVGTYKVTATGTGRFTGSTSASFTIVPPLVKGIKAPSRGKKKLTVRWKAMSKKQKKKYKNVITGYQVRVATKSNFSNAKYASVKGIKKTKKTVKGLKKKTTYYVQYRSYKTVGSVTYYSKWSSTKKAKTK